MEIQDNGKAVCSRREFLRISSATVASSFIPKMEFLRFPETTLVENVLPRADGLSKWQVFSPFDRAMLFAAISGPSSTAQSPWYPNTLHVKFGQEIVQAQLPGFLDTESGIVAVSQFNQNTRVLIRGTTDSSTGKAAFMLANSYGNEFTVGMTSLYNAVGCTRDMHTLALVDWKQHSDNDQIDITFRGWESAYDPITVVKTTEHRFSQAPETAVTQLRSRSEERSFFLAVITDPDLGNVIHGVSAWNPVAPTSSLDVQESERDVEARSPEFGSKETSQRAWNDYIFNPVAVNIDQYSSLIVGKDTNAEGAVGAVLIDQDEEGNLVREQIPVQYITSPSRSWRTGLIPVDNLKLNHKDRGELVNTDNGAPVFVSLVYYDNHNRFGMEVYSYNHEHKAVIQVAGFVLDDTAVCSMNQNNMLTVDKTEIKLEDYPGSGGTYYQITKGPINMTYHSEHHDVVVPAGSIRRRNIKEARTFIPLLGR